MKGMLPAKVVVQQTTEFHFEKPVGVNME